jgi:hypothetical protein
MRKPDILKLRRESLSKIMLSRKTEESRRQQLKLSTHTSSPLAAVITPKKRKTPDGTGSSPFKLTRIVESPSASPQPEAGAATEEPDPAAVQSTPSSSRSRVGGTRSGSSTPSRSIRRAQAELAAGSTGTPSVRVTPPRRAKEKSQASARDGEPYSFTPKLYRSIWIFNVASFQIFFNQNSGTGILSQISVGTCINFVLNVWLWICNPGIVIYFIYTGTFFSFTLFFDNHNESEEKCWYLCTGIPASVMTRATILSIGKFGTLKYTIVCFAPSVLKHVVKYRYRYRYHLAWHRYRSR